MTEMNEDELRGVMKKQSKRFHSMMLAAAVQLWTGSNLSGVCFIKLQLKDLATA